MYERTIGTLKSGRLIEGGRLIQGRYIQVRLYYYNLGVIEILALLCPDKGRTIRKVMGGGGGEGDFQLARFFFFRPLLVQEFFLQVKPSARIFYFSDKYCFVCRLRTHQLECARAGTRGFPRTSMRNGLLTGGRNNYFFLA